MADNKVVNTTQLEADLTSVANAIREKAGSTDSLAFPDGFVSAIGGILGMPSEIAELSTGVYVPASSANLTLEHGLSQKPHFAVFCAKFSPKFSPICKIVSLFLEIFLEIILAQNGAFRSILSSFRAKKPCCD